MKKIFSLLFFLIFMVNSTIGIEATNQKNTKDSIELVDSINGIDTYLISENNEEFSFTIDTVNLLVSVNQKVYTLENYFKALEIQAQFDISLESAINRFELVTPQMLIETSLTSNQRYSTQATNPPTSGYGSFGPYFYIQNINFGFIATSSCFAALASLFIISTATAQSHVTTVRNAAIVTGISLTATQIFYTDTYYKIRQAFHPTVMYAVKQEKQNCTRVGSQYFTSGSITTSYFWSQQPY